VAFYTLLAVWRIHRAAKREARRLWVEQNRQSNNRALLIETCSRPPDRMV
jgi:hypothetical protein